MARRPDCNRFVSNDEQDPEVESLECDGDGQVTAEVRIVNACAECSTELAEANFSPEVDLEAFAGHSGDGHDVTVDEGDTERTSRTTGKGRGARTFYGFRVSFDVTCTCGATASGEMSDDVQASAMDSLT